MRSKYDAVVIGSGFGGAITAHRLAAAGRSVAILEQGRRWPPTEFPRTVRQAGGAFWQEGQVPGFLEYRAFKKIDVVQGVGVGGGSLHYFNVNIRAPERIFRSWPQPYSRSLMDRYYDEVQARLESKPLKPPAGRALPPRTVTFCEAARRVGAEPEMLDIAVYTGPDRRNAAGVRQGPCTYCGNCMLGCQEQAKNTLDITYIADAENNHGAEVYPLHKASRIEPTNDGYRVHFSIRTLDGHTQDQGAVVGQKVVIAAGALGSTEILLRSRDEFRTLPKLTRALGHRFSGNGDLLLAGAMDVAPEHPVDPSFGPSITAVADFSTAEHAIHIEDLGYPDQMMWLVEGIIPPNRGRLVKSIALVGRYLKRSLGIAAVESRVSDQVAELLSGGRTARFLPYLGMGTDAADGRMSLSNGALDIHWRHRKSRPMFREMERRMRELSESIGGRYVTSFLWRWPTRKLLTAHPLGGCVMSDNENEGVVNHCGQVWNYPGLYVADGACLPSALSVNPSLTIGAVADRIVCWMIHGHERAP